MHEVTVEQEKCPHMNFMANVRVDRLEDSGRFAVDLHIKCDVCQLPFRFLGLPAGVDLNGATVSVDGEEARLAIAPRGKAASILDPDHDVGFTVRRVDRLGPMTDFEHMQRLVACCSISKLPAILESVVKACVERDVFAEGGMESFIKRITE